jgi:hypothetical protein
MEDRGVLKVQIDSLIAEMSKVVVDSDEKYQQLEAWVRRNKETQKVVIDAFEAERVSAKAAYDKVLADKNAMLKPLEAAETATRKAMVAWSTKREQERREEEERARAALAAEKSEDVLLQAETLEAIGRQDEADALLDKGPKVSKAAVAAAVTTAKVGKTMEKWEVKVTDMEKFVRALPGCGPVQECLEVNTSRLAALFKREGTKEFPGLEVRQTFVPVI